ncbi:hypothetical protein [Bacillus badius]|uniref:Phage protein n=1 Tax=Bacillus badius TaxID=1455 RepID=A0ABR5AVI8_BACBA|nr:hypothetical protein [Bacillus badius]KIL76661.1 hypothetical protein SD78_0763 [Bacillus badius]KIL78777.1 hypothetical protein SD77_4457 [Bacillus badius]KZR57673.1 hypothetical protein A3781_02505 [Bacillus badius]MED4715928.1 hypothetical protein [Bacillus badius]
MLNFNEKLAVIESFPQLKRNDVSLGRINFQFPDSVTEKKNIVYHLHPNGNGFVYAGELAGYQKDKKGMVNIREFSAEDLRQIIDESIQSLSPKTIAEEAIAGEAYEETWINRDNQTLLLVEEEDMWNVYAGLNLDGTFNSYGEAIQYLDEEGFHRLS